MWKRWSFKSLSSPAPDAIKTQAPPAEVPASKVSVEPEDTVGDKADSTKNVSLEESLSAVREFKERANEYPVASSANQSSVTNGPSDPAPPPDLADVSRPNDSLNLYVAPRPAEDGIVKDQELPPSPHIVPSAAEKPGESNTGTSGNGQGIVLETSTMVNAPSMHKSQPPTSRIRRISFRSIAFFYGRDGPPKSPPFSSSPSSKPITRENAKVPPDSKLSRSGEQALSSACALRTLIVGAGSFSVESSSDIPKITRKTTQSSRPSDLNRIKNQLLKTKSANAVIAQLRRLPPPDGPSFRSTGDANTPLIISHPDAGGLPIHAVCLPYTDEEAERRHFSRLHSNDIESSQEATATPLPSVRTASLESLASVLHDLRPISLLSSPDFGFGQPVSENEGVGNILSGSVPSAGTVVEGFEEITKQLIMLGFATSKSVFPNHAGIYPPEDRMSVLTYWWGLELVLPEPSIKYLSKAKSISNALINFLSAVALFNNGVREILPFIRYIANFVDFEFSAITAQDRGKGVVCAATWIMPAAMVPRPWDFPSRLPAKPTAVAPTTPIATPPTTSSTQGDVTSESKSHDVPPPLTTSSVPNPPLLATAILPQLKVTPATLPRGIFTPQPDPTD